VREEGAAGRDQTPADDVCQVMVAGGYVVLERPNPALVAAVSARVYSVVAPLADSLPASPGQRIVATGIEIEVLSPQMAQSRRYAVKCEGGACSLSRADDMGPNPYVEAALVNTVALVAHLKGAEALRPFSVSIHGDNAFYVMENEDGSKAENLPRFAPITQGSADKSQHAANVRKTGLGSSAALVTSMVAGILSHFKVITLPVTDDTGPEQQSSAGRGGGLDDEQLRQVHNLAQLSHCAAQGKIGSGFDVAAAVYGTMQYVRFSPQILDLSGKDTVGTADMAAVAHLVMATARGDSQGGVFDQEIGAWSLPSDMLLHIMLI